MNNKINFQLNNYRSIKIFKFVLVYCIFAIVFSIILLFFNYEIYFNLSNLIISVLLLIMCAIALNNHYKSIIFTQNYFIIETLLHRTYKIKYDEIIKANLNKIITKRRVIFLKNVNNKDKIIAQINKRII